MSEVDEVMESHLMKSGETYTTIEFIRNGVGLAVHVKSVPMIEEFFRDLGAGEVTDVAVSGRYWVAGKDIQSFQAYGLLNPKDINKADSYRFDRVGHPLIEATTSVDGGKYVKMVNLSFLRLRGISEGNGITFFVKGAHSSSGVEEIRDLTQKALANFYVKFLKPFNMSIQIVLQEMR